MVLPSASRYLLRAANILDLVLVNEPLLLSSLSVLDPVGNSDHDSDTLYNFVSRWNPRATR